MNSIDVYAIQKYVSGVLKRKSYMTLSENDMRQYKDSNLTMNKVIETDMVKRIINKWILA